jgi:hypothetical protein
VPAAVNARARARGLGRAIPVDDHERDALDVEGHAVPEDQDEHERHRQRQQDHLRIAGHVPELLEGDGAGPANGTGESGKGGGAHRRTSARKTSSRPASVASTSAVATPRSASRAARRPGPASSGSTRT